MNKLKVIILAAGEGKRMKSKLPKVLHKVQGKPMVKHVIDMAKNAGADDICVVIGHGGDAVKAALEEDVYKRQLMSRHFKKYIFQFALNSFFCISLFLPAFVSCSVVLYNKMCIRDSFLHL